jgi:hypothetical protein
MRISRDSKPVSLKLSADATHEFPERVIAIDTHGHVQKTARAYQTARARIATGPERSERTLRPERCLVVAQQVKGQTVVYSPAGALTPEELELVSEHFDTLAITGLLPGRAVNIGAAWKIDSDAVQALCSFEGLSEHSMTCKLEEVKAGIARVSVSGSATGIDLGAMVKLTVAGAYHFDIKSQRVVWLEWKQKDERGQGPASPTTTVESTTTLTRTPIPQPACLSDVALISVPDGDPPGTMTQLAYHHDSKTPFDLQYARDWQIVGQSTEHVVLRLLDRGDFVAQATLTPWERARPGEHLSPEAFRESTSKTPGWEQGEAVEDGEVPADGGRWIYRISAPGRMDGLKVVQNFYVVAGPGGEQVLLAFTMTPAQVEKLGTRDLALVRGISFPAKK